MNKFNYKMVNIVSTYKHVGAFVLLKLLNSKIGLTDFRTVQIIKLTNLEVAKYNFLNLYNIKMN
ncbi:TPA: hypothetical protein KSK13_003866 [Clostridioides difficile]|nr:hypothetical protein [Clostridioides difficile]